MNTGQIGDRLLSALETAASARSLIADAQELVREQPFRDGTAVEIEARKYQVDLIAWQLERAAELAEERIRYFDKIQSASEIEAELKCCADGLDGTLHWFRYYAWGFDPREDSPLQVMPFSLFEFQERYVEWIESLVFNQRASGLVEKARDMGATVGAINWIVKHWRFRPGFTAMLTSATEDLVDSKKDPDTLFEKARFAIRLMPEWMLPAGFNLEKDLPYMNIANPGNDSVITGSAPTGRVGRQRRRSIVLMDEFVSWPFGGYPQYTALSQTARSLLALGTPEGRFNKYAEWRHSGNANVFTMDWRAHPWKDKRWFDSLEPGYIGTPMTREQIAQEIERNYDASQPGKVFPEWKEEYCLITWDELIEFYRQFRLDRKFLKVDGSFQVPQDWTWCRTHDYGQTEGHPWVVTHAARPRENYPLSDTTFIFSCHKVTPTGAAVGQAQPQIAEIEMRLGFRDDDGKLTRYYEFSEHSHEALDVRNTFLEEHGEDWQPWNTDYTVGIPQLKEWMMLIEPRKPNPFRPQLMGRTRIVFVAMPSEFQCVKNDRTGGWFVTPSKTDAGFKLLREEIPAYHYPPEEAGKPLGKMRPAKIKDDACLVVGTLVQTLRGVVPIESVRRGDFALTRQGYRRVIEAGLTQNNAEIYRVECSDGRTLKGTGNHPVFTEEKGFISIDSLRAFDTISVCGERLLSLTALGFIGIQIQSIGRIVATISRTLVLECVELARSMKKYGSRQTARFRPTPIFITKTKTRSITQLRTWYACLLPIISGFTQRITEQLPLSDWSCLSESGLWPQSGTEALMGKLGMSKTAKKPGRNEKMRLRVASFAGIVTRQKADMEVSGFAPMFARIAQGMQFRTTIGIENVRSALSRCQIAPVSLKSSALGVVSLLACVALRLVRWLAGIAKVAVKSCRKQLDYRPAIAPVHVVAVIKEPNRQSVYNLTIDEVPEYFANGVLVHNCDTLRGIATHWGPSVAPLTQEEKAARLARAEMAAWQEQQRSEGADHLADAVEPNMDRDISHTSWYRRAVEKVRDEQSDEVWNVLDRLA